ncbi:MAG: site-specific DNA-methyltransferase [Microbacteriaceae bacterium]|nr:site-specific DNA-methyltransferase [Microbacteriaceae bacterium]
MTDSLLRLLPDLIDEARRTAESAIAAAREESATGDARDSCDSRDSRGSADGTGVPDPAAPAALLDPADPAGLVITDDNLRALARLAVAAPGSAALVYLDPPFDSRADYRSRILTRTAAGERLVVEHLAYRDRWADGTAEYLRMLVPRLVVALRLLRPDGALCVHLDWHASHLVRLVLDELLGRDAFVNHLVWSYRSGGASRTASVPRKHDDLLLYRAGPGFRIRGLRERQYLDKPFMGSRRDAEGRHYVDTILRDVLEGVRTLVDDDGATETVSVRPVLNVSAERTGYATQKPEGLLEILLRWTTDPGDLVVDAFGGSGTTAVVAHRLGRRFTTIDASPRAAAVARARLDAAGAPARLLAPAPRRDPAAVDARRTDGGAAVELVGFAPDPGFPTRLGGDADAAARDGLAAVAGWSVGGAAAWRTPAGELATRLPLTPPTAAGVEIEVVDLAGERTAAPLRD